MTDQQKSQLRFDNWANSAKRDEELIKAVIENSDKHAEVICFHSQQLAEKYLKGLLNYHKINFRKIHDLLRLAELLKNTCKDINTLEKDLILLNSCYIESRYPDNFTEFNSHDAQNAFEAAERVKNYALSKVDYS